jgi:small subunit ribosomal protein S4
VRPSQNQRKFPRVRTKLSKRASAKRKIDRRRGESIWGECPVNKRSYGPGQHGQRRAKSFPITAQLQAKQKLKG